MPDLMHWTSFVLETAAFLSVLLWAIRSVAREVRVTLVEIRKINQPQQLQLSFWNQANKE